MSSHSPSTITVARIRDALQASSHVIDLDPCQLPSQLCTNLFGEMGVSDFVASIQQSTAQPWIQPIAISKFESEKASIRTYAGGGEIMDVAVSQDGRFAATTGVENGLIVWDLLTGKRRSYIGPKVWRMTKGYLASSLFGPMAITRNNKHAVGSTYHGGVRVFDLKKAYLVRVERDSLPPGRAVKLSSDDVYATTVPNDGSNCSVLRWNLADFTCTNVLPAEHIDGRSFAFTTNGDWLVTLSLDGKLVLCCLDDPSRLAVYFGYPKLISGPLAITSDLRFLFGANENNQVVRIDLQSQESKVISIYDAGLPTGIHLSDDGHFLIAAYDGKWLHLWPEPVSEEPAESVHIVHDDYFSCADRIPDTNILTTAGRDGMVKTWKLEQLATVDDNADDTGGIIDLEYIGRTDAVVSSAVKGGLTIRSASKNTPIPYEPLNDARIDCLLYLESMGLVVVGLGVGIVFFIDPEKLSKYPEDAVVSGWNAHEEPISGLAVSNDGNCLFTCSADHTVRAWNIVEKTRVATLEQHTQAVSKVAMSPIDSAILATAGWDETTVIWNWHTNAVVTTLHGHDGPVRDAVYLMQGQILATASWDGIILWNTTTWERIGTLIGHQDQIESLHNGPLSHQLTSCSNDRTVRIWDLQTYSLTAVYTHDCAVAVLKINPDYKQICIGDAHGRLTFLRPHSLTSVTPYQPVGSALGEPTVSPGIKTKYLWNAFRSMT